MPKSKKRKMKHTPRRKAVQQSVGNTTQSENRTAIPVQSTAVPETITASAKTKINRAVKTQVIPQLSNVVTELKIISVITVALLAIIVILYFIFR